MKSEEYLQKNWDWNYMTRDLIDKAAEKIVAMPKEVLEKADEKKHNPWPAPGVV